MGFPHGSDGKDLLAMWKNPAMQETWVQSLEEGIETHSRILAWRIPRTEESGRLQSLGSQESNPRAGHD